VEESAKEKFLSDVGVMNQASTGAFRIDISRLPTQKMPVLGRFGGPVRLIPLSAADAIAQRISQKIPVPPRATTGKKGRGNPLRLPLRLPLRKSRLSFVVRLALTVLLFFFLFRSLSWSALFAAFVDIAWGRALVALVVGMGGVVASAYQWRGLLLSEKIRVDLAKLVNLYLVGIGFSHFLPTGMGGDAVKAWYVGRDSNNNAGSMSAVILCRVTGFLGMELLAWPALLLWRGSLFAPSLFVTFILLSLLVGGMIAGAMLAVVLLPRLLKGKWSHARVFVSLLQAGNALYAALRRPRALLAAVLYGVIFQLLAILNCYAYANALGIELSLRFYCVAVPLIALIAFLPISINGYGLRESTYVYLFSTMHVSSATALLLALLQDAQTLLFGIIGGCIYLRLSMHTKSAAHGQTPGVTMEVRYDDQ
jgi:uncharacterized membrane protein YbhN (UPF0104 family)